MRVGSLAVLTGVGLVLVGGMLAPGAFAPEALADDIVTNPDWLKKPTPEQMRAAWPYEAARKGIGGKAVISCEVDIQGLLKNCGVVSETPEGSGFGQAALLLAPSFKMKPRRVNGKPAEGGQVRIPISFEGPGDGQMMAGPPSLAIVDPIWATAPSFDDMAAAWPKVAGDIASGGAFLRCSVSKAGKLDNCATYNELPRDNGFGAAAKSLASKFTLKLDPNSQRGSRPPFVNVAFRFLNPDTPEGKARKLTQARWITTLDASKVQAVFPKQAADSGVKAGMGMADCLITADGHLAECKVAKEEPAGLGFGQSALLVAAIMQLNPWTDDGRPVGGARIKLPIRFGLAPEPSPPEQPKP